MIEGCMTYEEFCNDVARKEALWCLEAFKTVKVKNYIIRYKEAHGETSEVFFQALSARQAVEFLGIEPSSVVQILEVSDDFSTTYDATEFL